MSNLVRYPHMIRLLVAMAQGQEKYFTDHVEKILAPLSDVEVMALIHGDADEMRVVVTKHRIPNSILDLIAMMMDGEPISSFINPPKEQDIPPKKAMH